MTARARLDLLDMVRLESRPDVLTRTQLEEIAVRERVADRYWSHTDPIRELRVFWRAQTVRHLFHILPGETILVLSCGSGGLTRALGSITRGECPITAATFSGHQGPTPACPGAEVVRLADFPGDLFGRQFDYVIGTDLLDICNAPSLLGEVQALLRPGGRLLCFETNPWNPVFRVRVAFARWFPPLRHGNERDLFNQVQLYELLSELGYIGLGATCYDFLFRPIPRWLMMPARQLTLVLENTPVVRRLSGTILVHAQKPPRHRVRPPARMVEHEALRGAVSVVVPCHNEEMNVVPLVDGLIRHYDDYIGEFVLVDDNSRDRTRELLRWLAEQDPRVRPVIRTPPGGVGLALRDGLRHANGRYVLLMDCDFLHILPELREMFDAAARGDQVVLGSRFSRESVLINYPLMKILCNRSFHLLLTLLFRRRLRDVTNNLKLLSREVVDHLEIESPMFAANAETGLRPILMGYRTSLVPISWIDRTPDMGRSSFSLLKNGLGYLKVLGSLAWRSRFGARLLPRQLIRVRPTDEPRPDDVRQGRPPSPRPDPPEEAIR